MDTPPSFDPVRHRRGGRPRKAEDERHSEVLKIRITPDALAKLTAQAEAAGLSVSEYGRATIENNPVRVTVSQTAPPEVVQQLRIMGGNLRQALEEGRRGHFRDPATEAALTTAAQTISAELRRMLHGILDATPD